MRECQLPHVKASSSFGLNLVAGVRNLYQVISLALLLGDRFAQDMSDMVSDVPLRSATSEITDARHTGGEYASTKDVLWNLHTWAVSLNGHGQAAGRSR